MLYVFHVSLTIVSHGYYSQGSDWMDPDDPTVIAETELLGAAASIDAAAKKLSSLRPRRSLQVSRYLCELNCGDMVWIHENFFKAEPNLSELLITVIIN